MIAQDVCRRETCQRICSIHFSRNLHHFDVFRLDGFLNQQVLGLEMFQTSRAMPEQHGLACGSVHCVNQRISPHFTSHVTQNVPRLPRCSTPSQVAVCTNVEPDGGQLAEVLRCAIFSSSGFIRPVRNPWGVSHWCSPQAAMGSKERIAGNLSLVCTSASAFPRCTAFSWRTDKPPP